MRRWVVVGLAMTVIPAAGALSAPARASAGTPTWLFDYGIARAGSDLIPALTNVTALGPGSDGRVQLAFPDRVDELTDAGERSRTMAVPTPVAVSSDGHRDFVALAGGNGIRVYPDDSAVPVTWDAGRTVTAMAVETADPAFDEEVVWVADDPDPGAGPSPRIAAFDSTGDLITSFPSRVAHVTGLAALPSGTLLALDGPAGVVQRLTAQGIPVGRFGSTGAGAGQVSSPLGIAADAAGTVFIADTGNSRVDIFDGAGDYQGQFGAHVDFGTGVEQIYRPGEFSAPRSVVVDCIGRLHVLDVAPVGPQGRVAVFDGVAAPTGHCFGPATDGFAGPKGGVVAVDRAGDVYVATADSISKFTASGRLVTSWASPASGSGRWTSAASIAVSPAGEVYLVDSEAKRVLEFHAAGRFVRGWSGGDGYGPISIGVRPADGHLFVVYLDHAVDEFAADGRFVGQLKLAPLDRVDVWGWHLGFDGNTLLVPVQQQGPPYRTAVERFDRNDGYLSQVPGPGRAVEDDFLFGVAPYPGGGYLLDAAPSTGSGYIDGIASGLVDVSPSGTVGRVAEPLIPVGTAPSGGLAVDCAGRIIGDNFVTGRVFRLQTSGTVCRWLPTATTGPVTTSTTSSLVIRATVNPSAQVTRVRVQYGATAAHGHVTPWITLPSDNVALVRSVTLAGLAHAHRCHYRVQAINASGTVVGRDATGTTR
ncbi:hypothetical protein [Nocardioides ultimimeridianus]